MTTETAAPPAVSTRAGSRALPLAGRAAAVALALACAASVPVFHGWAAVPGLLAAVLLALAAYAALRASGREGVESVLLSFLLLTGVSLLGGLRLAGTAALAAASLGVLAWRRARLPAVLAEDVAALRVHGAFGPAAWLLAALLAAAAGMSFPAGFAVLDPVHPVYEHSIGRSFDQALLGAPDLSFAGKAIRFHPLSTQIPLYLSQVFGIPQLSAVHLAVPLLVLLHLFLMAGHVFAAFPAWRMPAFVMLFLPLLDLHPNTSDTLFYRTLVSPSFGLGTLLAVAATIFLARGRRVAFVLAMAALLLAKASFFITLLGGAGLFHLRKRDFKAMFAVGAANVATFVALYPVFLSKAHEHNLWLLGPFFLHPEPTVPITVLWSMVAAVAVAGFFLARRDDALLAASSVCLSGLLGTALLTEYTEGNAFQFLMAGFFFLPLLAWSLPAALFPAPSSLPRRLAHAGLCLLAAAAFAVTLRTRLVPMVSAWHFRVTGAPLPTGAIPMFKPKDKITSPDFGADLVSAYTWLGDNSPAGSVVLHGRHYETPPAEYTGYLRSALSGRQMVTEGEKYKGIAMQADYPARVARSLHFYRHFVQASPASAALLEPFFAEDWGRAPGVPLSASEDPALRRLHAFGMKKEWCWLNIRVKAAHEARAHRDSLSADPAWLRGFLRDAGIGYVVLENGDLPGEALAAATEPAYAAGSVRVLKVR